MRILIAHSFYRVAGGEDRYVRQQLDLLQDDHDVTLLSERNEDLTPGLATARRMVGSASHRRSVEATMRAFRPDVVHLHNPYPALGPSVHLAARTLGIPLVVTVHNYRLRCPNGFLFTEGEICTRCTGGNHVNAVLHRCFPSRAQGAAYASALWVHRFVRKLERDVDAYVTPSEHVRDTLAGWGIPERKLVTVRNFTDLPEAPRRGGGRFGVYLGRLSAEKGIDVLLAALERAGDPEFRIVGDGPVETELREAARARGLDRTRFLGRLDPDEVAAVLADALYLALPSVWHENAPLAALEAMARGIPLLVSDKGGLPELAGDGRGIVTPAGDVAALARGIEAMSGDAAAEMGERARRYASEHLTPRAHKSALEGVYSGLVEVKDIA